MKKLLLILFIIFPFTVKAADILEYKDGIPVTNVFPEKPEKVNHLIKITNCEWKNSGFNDIGYTSIDGVYQKVNYLLVNPGETTYENGEKQITCTTDKYYFVYTIVSVTNQSEKKQSIIPTKEGYIESKYEIYSDEDKTNKIYENDRGSKLFVELKINAYMKGTNNRIDLPWIYMNYSDVDASQSFKNKTIPITSTNSFIKSKEDWEPTVATMNNNMFNSTTGVLYSEYDKDTPSFSSKNTANLYQNISDQLSKGSMNIIFGYNSTAGSGLDIFTEEYIYTYNATTGGTVKNKTEYLYAEQTPKGPTQTPDEGYELVNWTTDQDVIVNSKTIKKDSPITEEQIKSLKAKENLSFTAHYKIIEYEVSYEISEDETWGTPKDIEFIYNSEKYHYHDLVNIIDSLSTTETYAFDKDGNKVAGVWMFIPWDNEDENIKDNSFEITKNTTLYGKWVFNPTEQNDDEPIESNPKTGSFLSIKLILISLIISVLIYTITKKKKLHKI